MVLIGVEIGRLIYPLLLQYLLLVGYILLGVLEGWEPRLQEQRGRGAPEDGAYAQERPEGSDSGRTDG